MKIGAKPRSRNSPSSLPLEQGHHAIGFGGATIEWKDGIVLSFLVAGGSTRLSQPPTPEGWSLAGDKPQCALIEQLASLFPTLTVDALPRRRPRTVSEKIFRVAWTGSSSLVPRVDRGSLSRGQLQGNGVPLRDIRMPATPAPRPPMLEVWAGDSEPAGASRRCEVALTANCIIAPAARRRRRCALRARRR